MEYTLFPLNNILPVSMYHNNLKEALCEFELGPFKFAKTRLSDWHRGNALTSHHCDPSLISGISMLDGHVVTTSDRRFSSLFSGLLPHRNHTNANIGANEHD